MEAKDWAAVLRKGEIEWDESPVLSDYPLWQSVYEDQNARGNYYNLDDLDRRTASILNELYLQLDPLARYGMTNDITSAYMIRRDTGAYAMNNLAVFGPMTYGRTHIRIRHLIESLELYPQLQNFHDWLRDPDVDELTRGLVVYRAVIELEGTPYVVQEGGSLDQRITLEPQVVDLMLEDVDASDDVLRILQENPGIDVGLVRAMMHSEQPSLRDGLL